MKIARPEDSSKAPKRESKSGNQTTIFSIRKQKCHQPKWIKMNKAEDEVKQQQQQHQQKQQLEDQLAFDKRQ